MIGWNHYRLEKTLVCVVAECPQLEDIGLGGVRTVGKFCQACKVIHRDRLSLGSGADEGRWMPERLACVFEGKFSGLGVGIHELLPIVLVPAVSGDVGTQGLKVFGPAGDDIGETS